MRAGISRSALADHFPSKSGGRTGCVWNWEHGIRTPSASQFNQLCKLLGIPVQPLEVVERQVLEQRRGVTKTFNVGSTDTIKQRNPITAPATDAARQWDGWGTALKPALEPITVARKPLTGTVATNVLAHGTGALNIDGCRVGTDDDLNGGRYSDNKQGDDGNSYGRGINERSANDYVQPAGRWPANLLHDGSDEVLAAFPDGAPAKAGRTGKRGGSSWHGCEGFGSPEAIGTWPADPGGSAARFFYCAKASKSDRGDGNTHPTVKPTDLMRYLCRLVTPPGGVVLDPFMGSGSTLKAAELEGFSGIGIELSPDYIAIAKRRIAGDAPLFADVEVA